MGHLVGAPSLPKLDYQLYPGINLLNRGKLYSNIKLDYNDDLFPVCIPISLAFLAKSFALNTHTHHTILKTLKPQKEDRKRKKKA